ncbi:MAG TPA: xanthine dehydrogenase small subunit, partial [Deltaproteobacteria bacterium]|nr:xanthine dehydrogenase small subunit [Deltaproteobacteria bacterium]
GVYTIGAGVRLSDLEAWAKDRLPIVARMLRYFASRQIKNRATVGGNLCNASPIGDLPPVMLALDATAVIRGPLGDRRVPMSEFFLAYRKTALQPGEVLLAVEVPEPPAGARQSAFKVSKRRELDISAVCAAMVVAMDASGNVLHARLAYGGMAATPSRAREAEAVLRRAPWTAETVEAAAEAIARDFNPINDHRGTVWYRARVAANLLRAFFDETSDASTPALPQRPVGTVVIGGRP